MFEKIRDIMAKQLNIEPAKITRDSDLINDLGADSLEVVEMLIKFEEEFGISVSDEQAQAMKTVGDFVKYVESVKPAKK
jgi:acyl carrier protein